MEKEEAHAFAILREIIQKFEMDVLYNTELPMLKLLFYQLDRLISIILPDLHNHFKVSIFDFNYINPFLLSTRTNK